MFPRFYGIRQCLSRTRHHSGGAPLTVRPEAGAAIHPNKKPRRDLSHQRTKDHQGSITVSFQNMHGKQSFLASEPGFPSLLANLNVSFWFETWSLTPYTSTTSKRFLAVPASKIHTKGRPSGGLELYSDQALRPVLLYSSSSIIATKLVNEVAVPRWNSTSVVQNS